MNKLVTCPQHQATFEAPIVEYGFVEMIEQCPSCGVGPVATNLQEIAESAVRVVLRAESAADLAAAVREFHPDFTEASEDTLLAYARDNHASGVRLEMTPAFAEVCVAAVRMMFPSVKGEIEP